MSEPIPMTLNVTRIRLAVVAAGLSLRRLAPLLGLSRSSLVRRLSGRAGWRAAELRRLERVLGVDRAWLAGGGANEALGGLPSPMPPPPSPAEVIRFPAPAEEDDRRLHISAPIPIVFICGPYRNADPWECEQNIRRAEAVAREVAIAGAMPLCPHSNTRPYFEGINDDAFWLNGTRELMRRCDAVVLLDGWAESAGAREEREEALRLGLPVFEDIAADLVEWLKQGGRP